MRTQHYHVYGLLNTETLTVEYVGCTTRIRRRFWEHFYGNANVASIGGFKGRTNLLMFVYRRFEIRRDALQYEFDLQVFHQLEPDRHKKGRRPSKSPGQSVS